MRVSAHSAYRLHCESLESPSNTSLIKPLISVCISDHILKLQPDMDAADIRNELARANEKLDRLEKLRDGAVERYAGREKIWNNRRVP